MKIITIFHNFNSSITTTIFIIIMCVGVLTWATGIIMTLLILLFVAFIIPAVDFLIINPIIKLLSLIQKNIEVYK